MNQPIQQHIPEGYLKNSAGHLVPVDAIKDIDKERNDLVLEIVAATLKHRAVLQDFKARVLGDIDAFVDLSVERFDVAIGGAKGNVTLMSFDGKYKVQRSIQEHITFDESLLAAKALIDECIHRWAVGSGTEIRALVEHAFQVDKQGNISTSRIMGLRRLDIKDQQWKKAMEAIADSLQVVGSQTYVRVYQRVGDSDQWSPLSLDIAKL